MYAGRKYDASWREPMWERVFNDLGADENAKNIVEALKTLYTMYTDDLVEWYANLYDPYYGAYYCTKSGKENEGFLPDVESTVQALRFIENCGMLDNYGKSWLNVFEDNKKAKLLQFAKRMQEPNGYFYNLLKRQEEIDEYIAKRGRDLGWCSTIIRELGARPTYDTPGGFKGNGIDAFGKKICNVKVTNESDNAPAASVNFPEYLTNRETFLDYLNNTVDIVNKSYVYGNQLNGTFGQIKARSDALIAEGADYSLCDILIDWLNERINPNTGYWSDKSTFAGTNGFFKVISIYNSWRKPYPALVKAAESVIAGILGDEPSTGNVCEVYNLWSAIISAKENARLCHDEKMQKIILLKIRDMMMKNGAMAILNTYKKQSGYQMPDGAFAHTVNKCLTAHQGKIPVGLGLEEGDVDAIGKATTGIVRAIFNAYEIESVPIYGEREWQIYKNIIDNSKPVIKKNTKIYR